MTARAIIQDLYISDEVRKTISIIQPSNCRDEVLQQTFEELLKKPEAKILQLHQENKLKPYVAGMIFKQAYGYNSTYRRIYKSSISTNELPEIATEPIPEPLPKVPLEKIYWFDAKIIELYATHGTYRKVAEVTGIEPTTIYRTVQRARMQLKKLMKNEST